MNMNMNKFISYIFAYNIMQQYLSLASEMHKTLGIPRSANLWKFLFISWSSKESKIEYN